VSKYYIKNKEKILKRTRLHHYSENKRCECGKLITNKSDKCKSCRQKGNLSSSWKGGKPKCKKCNVELKEWITKNQLCRKCFFESRKKDKPRCSKCGKILKNSYAKQCKECYIKTFSLGGNPMQNQKHTEKSKIKMSLSSGGTGIPYEDAEYPSTFTDELKNLIRKRDNYICQNCGMTEEEHLIVIGKVLTVHHIDYNKQNCDKPNLITLCNQCNLRANANRDYWTKIYLTKIMELNHA